MDINGKQHHEEEEAVDSSDDQIRVRFKTEHENYRVIETPFSIPTALNPSGLSDVINHLLESQDTSQKFSFFIQGYILQTSLHEFVKKYGISKEEVLEIEYTPEQGKVQEEREETLPDWVSCVSAVGDYVFAGCYDGSIRAYHANLQSTSGMLHSVKVHSEPVTSLCSVAQQDQFILFSGSKNGTINRAFFDVASEQFTQSNLYLQHNDSVSSVFVTQDREKLCSGTWDGSLYLWDLPAIVKEEGSVKKAKHSVNDSSHNSSAAGNVEPLSVLQGAHKTNVSGFCWGNGGSLVTGSWDHSLKIWDTSEDMRCVRTMHCNKVINSLASSSFGNTIVTAHPDKAIRLWDMRAKNAQSESTYESRTSHSAWVCDVAWSRETDYSFASIDYGGKICVWDSRAIKPLHEINAHQGKGLCVEWNTSGDAKNPMEVCALVSGGADKKVKMFSQ